MRDSTSHPTLIFPPVAATQCSILRQFSNIDACALFEILWLTSFFGGIFTEINAHLTFFHTTSHQGHYALTEHSISKLFKEIKPTSLRFLLLYSFILEEMSKNHNFIFYFTFQGVMHHLKRKYSSKSCC